MTTTTTDTDDTEVECEGCGAIVPEATVTYLRGGPATGTPYCPDCIDYI